MTYKFSAVFNLLLLLMTSPLAAQLTYQANNHFEWAAGQDRDSRFLENWTDLQIVYQNWRSGLRWEIHEPAAVYAQQKDGQALTNYFFEYRLRTLAVRAGTFNALFGRGLILRSFDNRTLRWDANIEGARVDYRSKYADIQALWGRPRQTRAGAANDLQSTSLVGLNERFQPIAGAEIRVKPASMFTAGAAIVEDPKAIDDQNGTRRGTLFGEINLEQGSVYGEYARLNSDNRSAQDDGTAAYIGGNLYLGDLTVQVEYKDYQNFAFQGGLVNNPPTVYREHLFTLMNRAQLIQNANSEHGYMVEASMPIPGEALALVNYSFTEDQSGEKLYRDMYFQLEKDDFWIGEWRLGGGRQENRVVRYLNATGSLAITLSDENALKLTVEHQHARENNSTPNRQFVDQLASISFSRTTGWTVSLLGEHSTDHTNDKDYVRGQAQTQHFFWGGAQLDLTVRDRFDLTVFGGSRRKGKVCIGGVCVVKPELEGIEVTLLARL